MATNIELGTKIDTANAARSMGELRRSLRDLIALQGQVGQGADFNRLAEAINEAEGRIGDLNDSFQTLRGSGVERLNGSLGLLRQGFTNADPTQIASGFRGLGSAMSAVPIFLVVEGFKLLIENFDKVVGVIKSIVGGFTDEDRELTKLTKTIELNKAANVGLIASIENEITILEAQGKSEKEIIDAKKKLTQVKIKEAENDIELQKLKIRDVLLNDSIWEGTLRVSAAIQRKIGNDQIADKIEQSIQINKKERLAEFQTALSQDIITINKLKTDQLAEEIKLETKQNQDTKKIHEDRAKDKLKIQQDLQNTFNKSLEEDTAFEEKRIAESDKNFKERTEAEQKEFERVEKFKTDLEAKAIAERDALNKAASDRAIAREKEEAAARFGIATEGVKSIQAISDLAFSIKQANTKKGTSEEEKAARAQFKLNKALGISSVIVSTVQGVMNALATPTLTPLGAALNTVRAISIGATGAANVAKIAATQFQSSAGGGGTSAPSASGGSSTGTGEGASIPSQKISPLNFNQQTVGQIGNPGGSNTPNNNNLSGGQNNYVSVTEIEKVGNKVKATETQAQFG